MGSCNGNQRIIEYRINELPLTLPSPVRHKEAILIQSRYRGYLERKRYRRMQEEAKNTDPKPRSEKNKHSNTTTAVESPDGKIVYKGAIENYDDRAKSISMFAKHTPHQTTKIRSGSFSPGETPPVQKERLSPEVIICETPSQTKRFQMKGNCVFSIIPILPHDKAIVNTSRNTRQKLPSIKLQSGNFYKGEWLDGRPDGKGSYVFSDQSKYTGDFKKGLFHGRGEFRTKDNHFYKGEWDQNNMKGFGVYTYPNNSIYEGFWENGLPSGKGKEVYRDGSMYQGDYLCGRKQGQGQMTFRDGSIYEGQFYNDLMEGFGTYVLDQCKQTWPDKRTYHGGWLKGKMHGVGELLYPDGRKYTGSYANDHREGFGVFEYPDGKKYSGNWHQGLQHGEGEFFRNAFVSVKGRWVLGLLQQ